MLNLGEHAGLCILTFGQKQRMGPKYKYNNLELLMMKQFIQSMSPLVSLDYNTVVQLYHLSLQTTTLQL